MSKERQRSYSNFDNVQLKQKIIHLQAELSRYKEIVMKYQNNYHYSQLDELNDEILKLKELLSKKEDEWSKLTKDKDEMVAHLKEVIDNNAELNNNYIKLKKENEEILNENNGINDEKEILKKENSNLQQLLTSREEELVQLRKTVEEYGSIKSEKNITGVKQASDATDSWFLRTIKQQSKNDE